MRKTTVESDGGPAPLPGGNAPRLGDIIAGRIDELAALSDEPEQLTRLYLGPAHRMAVAVVADWMREAGMSAHVDAVGNVVGRYDGQTLAAPALILGSHIDSVPAAGSYDGTLGVLVAIAAVEQLHASGRRMPFAIEVVAFGDEEGIRFPGTLTGSRALAGRFEPHLLDEADRDGISRRQALIDFGCDVGRIASLARDPTEVLGYLEVHIEQGPVLETEGRPIGIVTAINGATRGRIVVTGEGGHAGTVPMHLRRDAMTAAAEMILAIERRAVADDNLVATVGVLEVRAAAVNSVPAEVSFTLDVRSPSDELRLSVVRELQATFADIAKTRSVQVSVTLTYAAAAAPCDGHMTGVLAAAIERAGIDVRYLPSGAGHDALSFKDTFPFAMLFVRCRGGISHHPDEYASADDIDIAARILADSIAAFVPPDHRT